MSKIMTPNKSYISQKRKALLFPGGKTNKTVPASQPLRNVYYTLSTYKNSTILSYSTLTLSPKTGSVIICTFRKETESPT